MKKQKLIALSAFAMMIASQSVNSASPQGLNTSRFDNNKEEKNVPLNMAQLRGPAIKPPSSASPQKPEIEPVIFAEDDIEKIVKKQAASLSDKEKDETLSDDSAFPTAKTAIFAAEKGDFETVLNLTDPLLIQKVGKDKIIRTLTKMKIKAKERGGFLQIKFNSETSVEQGVSTIGLDLYFGDGTRDTKTVRLRQTEEKKWVVTS